jgi:hypothetical protein
MYVIRENIRMWLIKLNTLKEKEEYLSLTQIREAEAPKRWDTLFSFSL